jgi:hypothetical protein
MADQPRDPSKPKKESEKKQAETVVLTAEELRAIAGGGTTSGSGTTGTTTPTPTPSPKDIRL